jgi:ABC-type lipopolysaccharide export system ATPase subunit
MESWSSNSMLKIDISFKFKDLDFSFKADINRGEPYIFEVGERALADKLFWVLCGLDKGYTGTIQGEGVCFNASTWNNVLALGDRTMFLRGSVQRNIYKALRVRSNRKISLERTEEVIKLYNLEHLRKMSISLLEDDEIFAVSLARVHYRKIALIVYNSPLCNVGVTECVGGFKNLLPKYKDAYIVKVC